MKAIIFIGLLSSSPIFFMPTAIAQLNNFEATPSTAISNLTAILNNSATKISPDLLQNELIAAVKRICTESDTSGKCSASQIEQMLSAVKTAAGKDSSQLVSFLASLSAYGVDPDAITVAALLSGINPDITSQGGASGNASLQAAKALPLLSAPYSGAGGTGGDTGISEAGN